MSTLSTRLKIAEARRRAASARHDIAGVIAAKAQIADLQRRIAAKRSAA